MKSVPPFPPSELSCAWRTCRKIAALLARPSPRSARMARTCSFLQKPNKTWLRSGQQNQPRGEQPTAVLETEQGYSKVPGSDPSPHWRSHQDGSLQPLEVPNQEQQLLPHHTGRTASCCWCCREFLPLHTRAALCVFSREAVGLLCNDYFEMSNGSANI